METVVNNLKIVSKDTQDLVNGIEAVIAVINNKVETTDWHMPTSLKEYLNPKLFSLVNDLGACDKKRLKRMLNRCITNPSLRNINSVIHFLSKTVYNSLITANYIKLSVRETTIQNLREKYVESRKATDALYDEYKGIKGDYYKTKIMQKLK